MDDTISNYMNSWNGRVRASLLDFIILYQGAFDSRNTYPYSIFNLVSKLWGETSTPPLPTIYSTINRLEKDDLIRVNQKIVGGRVQKIITTTESGFIVQESMAKDLVGIIQSLNQFEVLK